MNVDRLLFFVLLFFVSTDHLKCETFQAVVSLMSGGGVGVGDRLDTLDTDLVNQIS